MFSFQSLCLSGFGSALIPRRRTGPAIPQSGSTTEAPSGLSQVTYMGFYSRVCGSRSLFPFPRGQCLGRLLIVPLTLADHLGNGGPLVVGG